MSVFLNWIKLLWWPFGQSNFYITLHFCPDQLGRKINILRIFQTENDNNKQIEGSFPVTVDVTALYTSIPADGEHGGIQAFEKALNQRKEEEINQTPTHFLITLLELVLHGNIFEFDDKLFRQQIGTAMGTRVAPTYACLFMGWLEEKILKTWKGTKPYL